MTKYPISMYRDTRHLYIFWKYCMYNLIANTDTKQDRVGCDYVPEMRRREMQNNVEINSPGNALARLVFIDRCRIV
jgi:hypothetical protein